MLQGRHVVSLRAVELGTSQAEGAANEVLAVLGEGTLASAMAEVDRGSSPSTSTSHV